MSVERWTIRRWPVSTDFPVWNVFDPSGQWVGAFETWREALELATSIGAQVEHWLRCETARWMGVDE